MSDQKMAAAYAHQQTRHKLRIYSQLFIMEMKPAPETTMQKDPTTGILVPVVEDYDYYPGKQLAVNYNGLGISHDEFQSQWSELGKAMWFEMQRNGVTRS